MVVMDDWSRQHLADWLANGQHPFDLSRYDADEVADWIVANNDRFKEDDGWSYVVGVFVEETS